MPVFTSIRHLMVILLTAIIVPVALGQSPAEITAEVDIANYQHYLEDLLYTHLGDNRGFGPQHDLARDNIVAELTDSGLSVALEPFQYNSTTYYNVVATHVGTVTPEQVYVVGAHFDSVNNPGADDNGTGTALVMEVARVLAQFEAHSTIHFVLFDREEQGLVGSSAFVADHAAEIIVQAVTADMIGHDSGAYGMDIYGTNASSSVLLGVAEAIDTYGAGLNRQLNFGSFAFSDHWPFEAAGIPACVIIEDCYQCNGNYHTLNDAVDSAPGYIDYPMIEDLLHAVVGYLVEEIGFGAACSGVADCADTDANGIRDDGCTWWECDHGVCVATEIPFADVGGQFGACGPDLTADGNDRFHALNCFADVDNDLTPGYPCEEGPPAALNVDAGGPFGDCNPDGVCDGNDAFHALNAFAGSSVCTCPLDGAPMPWSTLRRAGHAELLAISETRSIRPGAMLAVDVVVGSAVADLRGYQLHLGVSGGSTGQLELIDIVINDGAAFDRLAPWAAMNIRTGQMVAGLDSAGIAVSPKTYLATFIYQASPDAVGTFAIDILHDAHDPAHRTFLFATSDRDMIMLSSRPAVVTVSGRAWHTGDARRPPAQYGH